MKRITIILATIFFIGIQAPCAQVLAQINTVEELPTKVFENAAQAINQGDFEEAIRLLVPLAENGNVRAQMNLGTMYSVIEDESKALYWTKKAAESGNPKAQANLGLMYFYGRGVSQNDAMAAEWLKKAALQGNAGAQCTLGCLYLEGRGVEKDYDKAKALLYSAIKGGEVGAANNLAKTIEQGLGQPPDLKKAFGLYEIAAKFGDPAAQNRVGLAYQRGELRDRNIVTAKDWFIKSASQGDKYGQYHLGLLLLDEKPIDMLRALQWISLSARQGYEPAESELKKRVIALDESKKTALKKLVDSWRPSGVGVLNPGVK